MRTKGLVFVIFTVLLFSLGTMVTVIFNMAPDTTEVLAMFYLAMFLSVFGLIFFIIYLVQFKKSEMLPPWSKTVGALRLGALIAASAVIMLILRSTKLLNFATMAVIIAAVATAEILLKRKFSIKND